MDIKPLHHYQEKRREKRKQRQKRAVKKSRVSLTVVILVLVISALMISPLSEIIVKKLSRNSVNSSEDITIAKCGKIDFSLPFSEEDLTCIGFHPSQNPQAINLNPIGKQVDTKEMSLERAIRTLQNTNGPKYVMLERSVRNGKKTSAVDIGAKAGIIVRAPLSGEVTLVRKYKLYGYIDDFEIHITPTGYKDRHLVIIHISDIAVAKNDLIKRNKTALGKVRNLSKYFKPQLKDYSKENGDHAHMQINLLKPDGECFIKDN